MTSRIGTMMRGLLGGGGGDGEQVARPGAPVGEPVEYEGFRLQAAPCSRGGQWQVAGVITKEIDGEPKTYEFLRADMYGNKDAAVEVAIDKAKRIVDERGEKMFVEK